MIEKPTTLVLGAGASKPFGFPLGKELGEQIAEKLTKPINFIEEERWESIGDVLYSEEVKSIEWVTLRKRLFELGIREKEIEDLASRYPTSLQQSIDAFVRLNPNLSVVGRAMIANQLLPLESRNVKVAKNTWIDEVWQLIGYSKQAINQGNLSIVTFNYDRSVEFILHNAIMSSFGIPSEEAAELLSKIPIHHVYGSLGALPFQESELDAVAYGAQPNFSTQTIALQSMKLIPAKRENSEELGNIWAAIDKAKNICFLGFSYDAQNIATLVHETVKLDDKKVTGTAYGLGAAALNATKEEFQKYRVRRNRNSIILGKKNQKSIDLLQDIDIWN